jgi:DNA-binding IclR family transcriptional regulator
MSKTLVRGLELIEEVGLHGPMTVTELARLVGVHVSVASRTVASLEPEGWLRRTDDGKVAVGPRCALLGLISPTGMTIRRADALVRAISAVTGVATAASGLIGRDVMILAAASSPDSELPEGFSSRSPIYVMAAGRAIAAQLPAETLDSILPADPFPNVAQVLAMMSGSEPVVGYIESIGPGGEPSGTIPLSRAELADSIDSIQKDGFARDAGELHPAVHCIAMPWPTGDLPASIACIGSREAIDGHAAQIEACLTAAVKPGAGAQDVFGVAARG